MWTLLLLLLKRKRGLSGRGPRGAAGVSGTHGCSGRRRRGAGVRERIWLVAACRGGWGVRLLAPRSGAGQHGRLGRRFPRLSGAVDGGSVFGVMGHIVAPVHPYGLVVLGYLLLLLLDVDFRHLGGKHSPGLLEVGIIPSIPLHSEQPVSGRLVHVQILDEFTRFQP